MTILASFRANLGGTNMAYSVPTPNNYLQFPGVNIQYNLGGAYTCTAWSFVVPSGTTIVHLDAQVWVTSGWLSTGNAAAKWIKNFTTTAQFEATGIDIIAGMGAPSMPPGTLVMRASCDDQPNPGDYYGLFVYIDGSVITIDGNPAHTYMCATAFA
jgi:hypothetical protein